jgi:hypothetical protein
MLLCVDSKVFRHLFFPALYGCLLLPRSFPAASYSSLNGKIVPRKYKLVQNKKICTSLYSTKKLTKIVTSFVFMFQKILKKKSSTKIVQKFWFYYALHRAASAPVSQFGPPGGLAFSYLVIIKSMTDRQH